MPLTEGFDIVLEQVKRDGLPENRAIWKYIVTLPPGVYKEVCIDFKGKIEGLTNPANIFGEKATDATGVLEWGDSRISIDTFGTDPKQVDLTFVCLKAKKDSFFGTQFKLNFIGPSKGAPSGVSLHTNELVGRSRYAEKAASPNKIYNVTSRPRTRGDIPTRIMRLPHHETRIRGKIQAQLPVSPQALKTQGVTT